MSTVVAACVAVASAEAAEPADTITNRASLILCFLPTAMAAFVCSDGDGGRSGDSGGGGGVSGHSGSGGRIFRVVEVVAVMVQLLQLYPSHRH